MAWYRTGTVTVTNNSNIVSGAGTSWIEAAKDGDVFQGPDMISYEIAQIASTTSLRISPAYRGGSAAGQSYALIPTRSRDPEISAGISTLVQGYQAVRDNAGTGKFAAGTAGAPSLRGLSDQDTGINIPGDNLLQLIAGGVLQMGIDATGALTGQAADRLLKTVDISSGINANGRYFRFSNGLQICTFSATYAGSESDPAGTIRTVSWTFPAAFASAPSIFVSPLLYGEVGEFTGNKGGNAVTGLIAPALGLRLKVTGAGDLPVQVVAIGGYK